VAHLVEVAFKGNRKEFFLWDYPDPPPLHAAVIVDVDRGEDLGYIHALGDLAQKRNGGCSHGCGTSLPERKALRLASEKDRGLSKDLDRLNEDARRKAMERVKANGLGMKVSDAEWQWDRKKLTLYFTADKRVDFRNLVRDLASLFRTRIELKQIGVRDEAKRLDGIGRCGRQYCSASWLPELRPVNLGVEKDQRLSLRAAHFDAPSHTEWIDPTNTEAQDYAIDLAKDHRELVERALHMKKTGNEVMRVVGGREREMDVLGARQPVADERGGAAKRRPWDSVRAG